MIGEIRWSLIPFYDVVQQRNCFKRRPALLIAQADSSDYVALPVSRITRQANINPIYDIKVDPATYPNLNLTAVSYIRTHKQTIIHAGAITDLLGNLKSEYPDLYVEVLAKQEQFSNEITTQALT